MEFLRSSGELSQYELKLLIKHNIDTQLKFVNTETSKLSKLLDKFPENINQLKLKLLPQPVCLSSLYELDQKISYITGIEEFDKLLNGIGQPLKAGSVWELSGLVGVGKTEFLHTLALNFALNYVNSNQQVLFIDTKHDFSAARINTMLKERQADKRTGEKAMQAIRVKEANVSGCIIKSLEALNSKLKDADASVAHIKLVLIDSLPACLIYFTSEPERIQRLRFLTQLACLVRRLATQYGVAFVLGNLSFSNNDLVYSDDPDMDFTQNFASQCSTQIQQERPMLGRYWSTVSTLALALELTQADNSSTDGRRLLRVLRNCCGPSAGTCFVRFTDAGVL